MVLGWLTPFSTFLETRIGTSLGILSLNILPPLYLNNPNPFLYNHVSFLYTNSVFLVYYWKVLSKIVHFKQVLVWHFWIFNMAYHCYWFSCNQFFLSRTGHMYLWWNHKFSSLLIIWGKIEVHCAVTYIDPYVDSHIAPSLASLTQQISCIA